MKPKTTALVLSVLSLACLSYIGCKEQRNGTHPVSKELSEEQRNQKAFGETLTKNGKDCIEETKLITAYLLRFKDIKRADYYGDKLDALTNSEKASYINKTCAEIQQSLKKGTFDQAKFSNEARDRLMSESTSFVHDLRTIRKEMEQEINQ